MIDITGADLEEKSNKVIAPLLQVEDVSFHYGGVAALRSVTFKMDPGHCYGLIGANGSGKSTLLAVISGLRRGRQEGTVRYKGQDCTRWSADRRARAGISRTFQTVRLIEDLSVLENVLVGTTKAPRNDLISRTSGKYWQRWSRQEVRRRDKAMEVLCRVGLEEVVDARPTSLPYGLQRRVEIARAIVSEPAMLLLDEPTAGMSAKERRELGATFRACADTGQSVLLVEHDVDFVSETCGHIWVLELGEIIAAGSPEEVLNNSQVQASYLGTIL